MGEEKLKKKLKIKDGEKLAKGYDLKKRKMKKKEKNEPKILPLLEIEEKSHDLKEERETAKGSEKKRKSVKNRKNFEGEQANHLNYEADKSMEEGRGKKRKLVRHRKTKNEEVIEADIDEVIEPSDAMVDDLSAKNFPVEVGEKKRSKTMKKKRKDRKIKKAEQQVVGLDNELETKDEELFEADIDGIEELSDAMKNGLNGQNFIAETREKNNRSKSRLKKRTKETDEQIVELQNEVEDDYNKQAGKSKKTHKFKRKGNLLLQSDKLPARTEEADQNDVYEMSSGDEDCSKGMKKWIREYHQSQPGIQMLQERIDDFITAHEEQLEQERKEREARAAEGGWTVVVHHKGRKKTTESESGIVVGSVAQAVVTDKLAKKKTKEAGLDFYRFQKRDAHRNEIRMLQSKFEQDKKRVQQMRAERKFRPY